MADSYIGKFVSMTLKIEEKFTDGDAYDDDKYATHYICTDIEGKELHFIIRDCIQDKNLNLIAGDVIKVYGEGAGNYSVYDEVSFQVMFFLLGYILKRINHLGIEG
jgi:hypothetical protein